MSETYSFNYEEINDTDGYRISCQVITDERELLFFGEQAEFLVKRVHELMYL